MGHTNSTTNYGLPQFITTDKPAWLTDINGAFSDIDTGLDAAKDAADAAQGDATQALTDAGNAATAAAAADAKGSGAVASIEAAFDPTTIYAVGAKVMYNSLLYRCNVAIITPGPWTGAANWERITVDSLIPESGNDLPLIPGSLTSVSGAIGDLQSNKSNLVSTAEKAGVFNVGANVDANVDIGVTETNFTPIGVVAYAIGNTNCFVNAISFNNSNTIRLRIRNLAGVALSNIPVYITVLYVKNS